MELLRYDDIDLSQTVKRSEEDVNNVLDAVSDILKNVRQNKDQALKDYTQKFDKVTIDNLKVTDEEIKNAPIQIKSKLLDIKYSRLFCDILIEPYAILNNFNMTNNHNYLIISEYTKIKTNEIVEYVIYNDTKLIIRNLLIQENYNKEKEEIIIQLIKLKTNFTILNQESITKIEHFLEISNIESPYLKEIYETIYDSKQTKSKHKVNIIKI